MYITNSGSAGLYAFLLNANRRSNQELNSALERISTGKRINRAADDPSQFARLQQFKTQYSEMVQLAQMTQDPTTKPAFQAIATSLDTLLTQAGTVATAVSGGDKTGVQGLLDAVKALAASTTTSGQLAYAGDPDNLTQIEIVHAATHGSLVTGTIDPVSTITLNGDTTVNVGGTPTSKSTLNFTLDGANYQVFITPGTQSYSNLVNGVVSAINTQTSLRFGTDITGGIEGNTLVLRSGTTGAASTITNATGEVATALGLTTATANPGVDGSTETIDGYGAPLTFSIAGRPVTLDNFTVHADKLQAALTSNDTAGIQAAISGLTDSLQNGKMAANLAVSLLSSDTISRTAQAAVLKTQISQMEDVDLSAEQNRIAKHQLLAQQAMWAIQVYGQAQQLQAQTLLSSLR